MALNAGFTAFKRVYDNPALAHQQGQAYQQTGQFNLLWAYYNNSVFDNLESSWQAYRKRYSLYRNIRSIYNPTKRLVNFYAGAIYPGVLSEDGSKLPDGVSLAIPLASDTSPELKDAIAQFWQWSNFQSLKSLEPRYGAALGSVLVELIDDVEKGKVTAEIVWPGYVVDLNLDAAGNVKSYALQYQVSENATSDVTLQDQSNLQIQYTYRKEVNQAEIKYFKNNQPFDYTGNGSVIPNVYGFCPAVWIKHSDNGGNFGSPAIDGSLAKIDELNSLASHVHDQIHKVINAPVIFWSKDKLSMLSGGPGQKRGNTEDFVYPDADRESLVILQGGEGGHTESLAGSLSLADSLPYMDALVREIEQDHPELSFYRELRSMSTLTGPAASRIMGDVSGLVNDIAANYDQANISLFRMAVAISGMRANDRQGGWQNGTKQQAKFLQFNLDSYQRGDLDFAIAPRPLVTPTKQEKAQEKLSFWQGVEAATSAGVPLEVTLLDEGWSQEQVDALGQSKLDAIELQQKLTQEDTIPNVQQ